MTVTARALAILVVDSLGLQDVSPEDVDVSAPLFGSGLGLDSLDLLEIALVIQQNFDVKVKANDPNVDQIFGSLQMLTNYINSTQTNRG